jgi:hypothetical protein
MIAKPAEIEHDPNSFGEPTPKRVNKVCPQSTTFEKLSEKTVRMGLIAFQKEVIRKEHVARMDVIKIEHEAKMEELIRKEQEAADAQKQYYEIKLNSAFNAITSSNQLFSFLRQ